MPLLRFDLVEGRSDTELKALLDAAHEAVVEVFGVPVRDRYQVVNEHKPSRLIVEDTGLGIPRTNKVVVLQMTSRPRGRDAQEKFYRVLVEKLEAACGIGPDDVMVSITVTRDEDWSFGKGRAQFLTGEL